MNGVLHQEFEKQFKMQFKPLCLFALRMVNSIDDSEDIVQQAFVDVWEKLQTGIKILEMKPYLYQAVRNRCLNYLKQVSQNIPIENVVDLADTVENDQAILAEREAKLWTIIDNLPTERKKIFLFAKRDGLKYAEIAEELGISVKTVENQMSKALKTLKETAIKIYLFLFA